ncbi:sensor histidine kinase [Halarcobacter bivalviorum]|uniref:sensor histidine kinase n=1 Tax=Halarcobacter bivalviorum TaxID=663364 RepID=UPI00100B1106|nr:cache domain-containing protein [Halarcobacter bivalviorum]RXK08187.1 histidine kinase [Halarcobacter bivalviorum]
MIFQNEKQLLKIIKYTPSFFIIILSLIIIIFQFIDKNQTFEKEKNRITQEYIEENKKIIETRVDSTYDFIVREKQNTQQELENSLKNAVQNAYSIANSIYQKNKDKEPALIKKLIIDALRDIRFNEGRGYYFIYEKSGKNLLLPYKEEWEGKNLINHQDSKGTYIIQDMKEILSKRDETFYSWYWYNPKKPDIMREKLGFVKNFAPFDWFIGTGEYVKEFEKRVQEKVLGHIKKLRFGKNGYIFIITYDSIYLSHIKKEYIGNDAITNNDTEKVKSVIDTLIEISKKGQGFYEYIQHTKPDGTESIKKVSYVKGLEDWQWVVGTGFYEDELKGAINRKKEEIENKYKESFYNTLKVSIFLAIFLLISSIYFSKVLQRKFKKYKNEIRQHLLENTRQQNILAQQSKMAAMGEMIGNIAHQWRQPLSTISTTATGLKLQKELGILDESFLEDSLEGINNSAQYLSKTIDDFRNFFRTDKNKIEFSIQKALDKALSLIYVQFHNKDIEIIKNSFDMNITNLENEFIQVVINILNNARDELIKKESSYKKYIFINVSKKGKFLKINIKDNAGGIKEDIISRIFEPYFTTKHKAQGTGIGLYMSQEIITKNMNGEISVENISFNYNNIDYKGASFIIYLPCDN